MPRRFEIISNLIHQNNYKTIVEIGVQQGRTTKYVLENCPLIEKYIGVDISDSSGVSDSRFVFMKMRSTTASLIFPSQSVDLVFIDADHSYESVKDDISHWKSKVKKGGILCGHDYGNEFHPGVKKSVDEHFGNNGLEIVSSGDSSNDNLWVVKIKEES